MAKMRPCEYITIETGEHMNNDVYSKVILDVIKYIAFLNCQLPLPYDRLQSCMNKYDPENLDAIFPNNVTADMYLRSISAKIEEMDTVFKALDAQYRSDNPPVELCIAIGSTPSTSKEVYHIVTPHLPSARTSLLCDNKSTIKNILLKFITNPALANIKHQVRKPSLTYTFIKKLKADGAPADEQFVAVSEVFVPPGATRTSIRLQTKGPSGTVDIFEDSIGASGQSLAGDCGTPSSDTADDNAEWFQCVGVLRGFCDKSIKGRSVLFKLKENEQSLTTISS